MKSNILALFSAAVGFGSGFIVTYKLRNRRRISGSLRELYEDNTVSMDWGCFL